jgi:hypothetical protein
MYTDLIFKEQIQVPRIIDFGLSQLYYSMQHIDLYDFLCFEVKIFIPQSLRISVISWYNENLLPPDHSRTEKTIRNNMMWPCLIQDFNIDYL